jgi:hypothetical protein
MKILTPIVLLGFLFSVNFIIQRKSEKAFLYIMLPSIFLFPHKLFIRLSSIPLLDLTFATTSIIAIGLWIILYKLNKIKIDVLDILIIFYLLVQLAIGIYKGEFGAVLRGVQMNIVTTYFVYLICKYFFYSNEMIKKTLSIITLCSLIMLVFSPIEIIKGDYIIKYFWSDFYPFFQQGQRFGMNRIQLFYSHPIIAGIIYSCISIISIINYKYIENKKKIWLIFAIISIIGTFLSISRGPILFLLIFYIIYIFKNIKSNYKWILLIVILIGSGIVINRLNLNFIDSSIKYRLNLISNANELINGSPLIGYGGKIKYKGNIGYDWAKGEYMTIDNFYLYRIFTGGLISLSIFLAIVFKILHYYIKLNKIKDINKEDKYLINLSFIVIIIILLNYIFVANMYRTDVLLYIMFAIISKKYEEYYNLKYKEKKYKFERIL